MLNKRKLQARMIENGVTPENMSELLGVNPATYYRKINGVSDFTRCEIQLIRNALHLSNDETESIFFAE